MSERRSLSHRKQVSFQFFRKNNSLFVLCSSAAGRQAAGGAGRGGRSDHGRLQRIPHLRGRWRDLAESVRRRSREHSLRECAAGPHLELLAWPLAPPPLRRRSREHSLRECAAGPHPAALSCWPGPSPPRPCASHPRSCVPEKGHVREGPEHVPALLRRSVCRRGGCASLCRQVRRQ